MDKIDKHNEVNEVTIENVKCYRADEMCNLLDIEDPNAVLAALDNEGEKIELVARSKDTGLKEKTIMVTLPGLFCLLFHSPNEVGKDFRRWVTHDVLPSIISAGGIPNNMTDIMKEDHQTIKFFLAAIRKKITADDFIDYVEETASKVLAN